MKPIKKSVSSHRKPLIDVRLVNRGSTYIIPQGWVGKIDVVCTYSKRWRPQEVVTVQAYLYRRILPGLLTDLLIQEAQRMGWPINDDEKPAIKKEISTQLNKLLPRHRDYLLQRGYPVCFTVH